MEVTVLQIPHKKSQSQQTLGLDKGTRDALADYARHLWPCGTAKHCARAWGLSIAESHGVVAGRTSFTTYDKIKKAGGWALIFAVEAMVIGHGADQYLIELRATHETQSKRIDALVGTLWPWPSPGVSDPDRVAPTPPDRLQLVDRRARQG